MVTEGAGGRVIAGRYRLQSRLGRGGMGVVWSATDELLGRRVAVKELPHDESLSVAEARLRRDRTLREARAVAQLSHPHIIVVHDVVEDDERPYIVMELVAGGSLADRIARYGPVDHPAAARIGLALLGALRTAHEAGVLHRDVKPSNVLVADGGRIVLTDFGVAQVPGATTLTESGTFVGSPEYTAPEGMSGGVAGPESDLWSLGALLCEILSGASPFRRESLGGILHAVVMAEIQPPPEAGPLLPVITGLLERDPTRRLNATESERLLQAYLTTGRTPAPDGGRRRFSRRAVLTAALLVAAAAGAGLTATALLVDGGGDGGGDHGPTSTASVPGTGPSGSRPPSPVPTATVTVTRTPSSPAASSEPPVSPSEGVAVTE
ncbi:serine/threonine-protein kinase [Streptomyces sp. CRN 30]|uniref:serine/threonine-protein kinase n=1 Tax=Streptomyces sp. CRN 30 TaxID=3075613 RepID=UPI002A80B36F|nr:serine/threonine-protein kinase [Streptomyces sp. CRN 30]